VAVNRSGVDLRDLGMGQQPVLAVVRRSDARVEQAGHHRPRRPDLDPCPPRSWCSPPSPLPSPAACRAEPARRPDRHRQADASPPSCKGHRGQRLVALRPPGVGPPLALPARRRSGTSSPPVPWLKATSTWLISRRRSSSQQRRTTTSQPSIAPGSSAPLATSKEPTPGCGATSSTEQTMNSGRSNCRLEPRRSSNESVPPRRAGAAPADSTRGGEAVHHISVVRCRDVATSGNSPDNVKIYPLSRHCLAT
jgi:hypothetical protein